ncbi:hypothetical protein NKDENANG_03919 [Candidatus Entotheonellaceae bacterium PAL068K]
MEEITPWLIEKWRVAERQRGKAPSTMNRDLTALKAVLSKAVAWGFLETHPLGQLKSIKADTQVSVRYLTPDEEQCLHAALIRRDNRLKQARDRGNAWRRERGYLEMPLIAHHAYGEHLIPMVVLRLNTVLRRGKIFNFTCGTTSIFRLKPSPLPAGGQEWPNPPSTPHCRGV